MVGKNERTTVLIAEDEEINFIYFNTMFKYAKTRNFEIIHAKNGEEVVKICKENESIDIILMDIRMPLMNGYDATMEIRKFNSVIPIIAQTAFAREDDKRRALESGCNDYIAKPVKKDVLLEMIEKLLNK